MTNSIQLGKSEAPNMKMLMSNIKLEKKGKMDWNILFEDIVNINYNNPAEIFHYLLDKVEKHKRYFFCGFDLFHLNDFNSSLSSIENCFNVTEKQKRKEIAAALKWITKSYTVKPKQSSLFSFLAFVVKNYSLSKEKQVILIQGVKGSGKSTQLIDSLNFFEYLNKMEFIVDEIETTRRRVETHKVKKNDLYQFRSKAISTNKEPKIISSLKEESMQVKVMNMKSSSIEEKIFAGKEIIFFLKKAIRILNLFLNSVGANDKKTSNGVLSLEIKMEETDKNCLIRLAKVKVNFVMDHLMENKWLGGFESLYSFLFSSSETFLNAYGLSKNPKDHFGLFFSSFIKSKSEYYKNEWKEIENLLPNKYLKGIQKILCSILTLINFNSDNVLKEINYLSILLEVEKEYLEEYFKLENEDISAREKQKEYKKKGKIMAKILYRLVLDSLITFFNVQMFEIFRVTSDENENIRNPKYDIELVDFLGYSDKDSSKSKSKKDNGKYEFLTNWLNEKMFNFYSKNKFEKKDMELNEKINYSKNDEILDKIERNKNSILNSMIGKNFEEAKDEVDKNHLIFLKKAMNFLNQSQMRTTSLSEEDYLIEIPHFFKNSVNYDLKAIYDLTQSQSFNFQEFWTEIVIKSENYIRPENWNIKEIIVSQFVLMKYEYGKQTNDWKMFINNKLNDIMIQSDSDIDDIFFEWDEFMMEFENNNNVYFLNCLKIDKLTNMKEKEMELYKTFEGVDFESLINYYKKCFSVKYSYEFFYKKFGLEKTVSQFLGENIAFKEIEELNRITQNMISFILPESESFKLENKFLKVKHDFFDKMEQQLKKLKTHKILKKIISEMLAIALRNKIKNKNPKSFKIATNFIRKISKPSLMQTVHKVKNRFMEIAEKVKLRLKNKKDDEEMEIFAESYMKELIDDIVEQRIIQIQSYFRMKKCQKLLKNLKEENEIKKSFEKKLQEKRNVVETMMVLQSFYEKNCLLDFLRLRKKYLMKIFKFLRNCQFKMSINKRIHKRKKEKLLSKMKETENEIVTNFYKSVKKKSVLDEYEKLSKDPSVNCSLILPTVPNKNFIQKLNKIRFAIFGIHMQEVEEGTTLESYCDSLSETLNFITQKKDTILNISIQGDFCMINTLKQSLYLFSLSDSNLKMEIHLPFKIISAFYFNDLLYLIDESKKLRLKYVPFKQEELDSIYNSEMDSENEKEATFIFAKFKEMKLEGNMFVGSTECDKLCIKENLQETESPMQIFQFKRKINKISCGDNFMMILDKDGVLYGTGNNKYGQLGQGNCDEVQGIVPVQKLSYQKAIIKSFSCGKYHVIASTNGNKIFSWGNNSQGQVNPFFLNNGISKMEIIDQPIKVFDTIKEVLKGEDKIQLKAGNYSSWILTSNSKLFMFGQFSQYKEENETENKIKKWDLNKIYGQHFLPISLEIERNSSVEIIYFRFINGYSWKTTQKPKLKILHKRLFNTYIDSSSYLIEFSDNLAKNIDLAFMTNKIIESKNKQHKKILQKEKQRTWNFIMLSSKLK